MQMRGRKFIFIVRFGVLCPYRFNPSLGNIFCQIQFRVYILRLWTREMRDHLFFPCFPQVNSCPFCTLLFFLRVKTWFFSSSGTGDFIVRIRKRRHFRKVIMIDACQLYEYRIWDYIYHRHKLEQKTVSQINTRWDMVGCQIYEYRVWDYQCNLHRISVMGLLYSGRENKKKRWCKGRELCCEQYTV